MPTPTESPAQILDKGLAKIDWFSIVFTAVIKVLFVLWPLLLLVGIVALIRFGFWFYHYQLLSRAGMFEIDEMSGAEFEERLAILFSHLGYAVQRTGMIGDYGVDLVIEKNGLRTAVQAKCYKSGKVHPDAVQQVYAGKNEYHCTEAIVVSNRNFTTEAWRLARSDNVKLWSRKYLAKVLLTEGSLVKNY